MRTNIDIDDELMEKTLRLSEATTKKAAVEEAMRLFVRIKGRTSLRASFGSIPNWEGDLEQSRLNRIPDDAWEK